MHRVLRLGCAQISKFGCSATASCLSCACRLWPAYARVASQIGAELLNVAIDTSGSLAPGAMRLIEAVGEEGAPWRAGTWTSAAIKRQRAGYAERLLRRNTHVGCG